MVKFLSLGSGSSGNCYFLYTETDGLLIDAGVSIRAIKKYFRDYGLSLSHIKNILITHDHADHIKAVGAFSMEIDAPVYATKDVHIGILQNYCVRKKVPEANVRVINKGETFLLNQFTITPFGVPHDSRDNVGYLIKIEDTAFGLITDVGKVTPEVGKIVSSCNYLVIEANHDEGLVRSGRYPLHLQARILSDTGHMSNSTCGATLARYATKQLKHVWLCHLSEDNNRADLAIDTIKYQWHLLKEQEVTPFKLEALNRRRPTGIFELI